MVLRPKSEREIEGRRKVRPNRSARIQGSMKSRDSISLSEQVNAINRLADHVVPLCAGLVLKRKTWVSLRWTLIVLNRQR